MYLRTPKRYTRRGRPGLINLRWLWLYLLTPIVLLVALLAWNYRDPISQQIAEWSKDKVKFNLNPPTITPTVPASDLLAQEQENLTAGNIQKVIGVLDQLTNLQQNNVDVFTWEARLILLRTDTSDLTVPATRTNLDKALDVAEGAINASPEKPDGWITTAMVLDWSGKPQQALPYALRAKDLGDKDAMVLAVLADIYYDLQKYEISGKTVDEAISVGNAAQPTPKMALVHAYFVKFKLLALDPATAGSDEGQTTLEKAWKLALTDPTIPAGYVAQLLGALYFISYPDRAVTLYQQAMDRDKDDPLMPYLLGLVYQKQGKTSEARQQFNHCLDLQPDQPKCLLNLGRLLYGDNNLVQALDVMEKLIAQGTKETAPYYIAGQIYYTQNECNKAIPLWQQGIKYVPVDKPDLRTNFEDALRTCGAAPDNSAGLVTPSPTPGQ